MKIFLDFSEFQISGDFDDRKIVEGVTGERNIFKKRGDQDPNPASPQEKPKRLRFAVVCRKFIPCNVLFRMYPHLCIDLMGKIRDWKELCYLH